MIWVTWQNDRGRTYLFGPYSSAEKANEIIDTRLDYSAELHNINTTDRFKAASILKHKIMESRDGNAQQATRNFRHQMA